MPEDIHGTRSDEPFPEDAQIAIYRKQIADIESREEALRRKIAALGQRCETCRWWKPAGIQWHDDGLCRDELLSGSLVDGEDFIIFGTEEIEVMTRLGYTCEFWEAKK